MKNNPLLLWNKKYSLKKIKHENLSGTKIVRK